jgi:glycosyltransferase involved in cell wall biosynthesis
VSTDPNAPSNSDTALFLVMPAYNEQDNIEAVVAQWHPVVEKIGGDARLLIVNDGSKDNTSAILHELEKRTVEGNVLKFPRLIALDKPNSGHGATCLFAYNKAIELGAKYIFQTDSDGQTDPDEFWKFWEKRADFDFIIGSRGGRQDGFSRIVVTKVLKLVIWLIFGEKVRDANTPFRLMRAGRLAKILAVIPKDFFLSNVLVSTIAVKWKERCVWEPITFKPRQGGVNSINLRRIFKIGWKAVGDFCAIKRQLKARSE